METTFNDVMENLENLPIPEQELVIDIVHKRINEYKRNEIIKDVREGRIYYDSGKVKRGSIDDLIKELKDD